MARSAPRRSLRTRPWRRYLCAASKQLLSVLLCLIVLVPFYLVVINAFKTKGESARMNVAFPAVWHFENFSEVMEKGKLVQGFLNSLLYAGASSFVGVMISAMAAFVMCRKRTRLNRGLFYFILCGLFFPVNYVTLIQVLNFFGLNDTRLGLVLVYTAGMIPFCVFVMRNFVLTVPVELDEAALLDGVGPLRLFFNIATPLLKPALITCFLLQFMGVWSDFLTPLYIISSSKLWPMFRMKASRVANCASVSPGNPTITVVRRVKPISRALVRNVCTLPMRLEKNHLELILALKAMYSF